MMMMMMMMKIVMMMMMMTEIPALITFQIEREVDEEAEGLSTSFKENKNPISPAAGDEEKKESNQEEGASIAADTMRYSQRLLQKKDALLKRIAKLQKQCEE